MVDGHTVRGDDARDAQPRARRGRRPRLARIAALTLAVVASNVAVAAAEPPPPGSTFDLTSFTTSVLDADGNDLTQAAAHPSTATAEFAFTTYTSTEQNREVPVEDVKQVITDLPPGFVGNPQVGPKCALDLLPSNAFTPSRCSDDSAVGVVTITGGISIDRAAVYNMVPERGYPAQFGFSALGYTYMLYPEIRSDGDYGLTIKVLGAPYNQHRAISLTFCGNGAEKSGGGLSQIFECYEEGAPGASAKPFLTNPVTECTDKPPTTKLSVDSWEHPGVFKSREFASPLITGCDRLTFEPSVDVTPTVKQPDAPTGLDVDMTFPQEDNAEGLAPPALKKAVVTFPEGMTINPAGANGLQACADEDLKLRSKEPVRCPDAAKVGTVTAKSPLLDEEITGGVYIRSQNSGDPESGEMFRIALVLENEERGISIRLPGSIRANKDTGRLETTFDNNPELPVSDLNLQFKGGPNAPLASPPTCGEKTVDSQLTSWGGQTVTRKSTFRIDCTPGLGAFSPSFSAGAVNPIAGASSPFALKIGKPDGNADLNGLRLEMPEGLLATIKGNLGTRVGTATVGAGPGSSPYWLHGPVVLEGPYGDAPYSLRVTVPAKAGPFDLGDVVVRQKIYVDPHDAHVTIVSDPLPTIVKGVPVRLQNLNVAVDKPGFMRNPTSCAEKTISATLGAAGGQTAAVSSRFQVGGCKDLPLKPQLTLAMTDPKATTQNKTTPFSATVTQTSDETALKKVVVTMPPTLSLLADNAQALCKPAEAAVKNCPKGSIVGKASATTPLLDEPLTGDVYFVEGTRVTASGKVTSALPKLWVALRGPIALDLWADTDVKNNRLINTFGFVPDAPIASFKLDIFGGKNGILAVAQKDGKANVCTGEQVADAVFDGQNGKQVRQRTRVTTPCGFGIVSQRLYSTTVKVRVGGLGHGKLTVSGKGIKKTTRTIKSSTVATVSAKLTGSGKRSYKGRKALKLRATFTPTAPRGTATKGKPQSRTVTVKRAAAKQAKKAAKKSSSKK